MLVFKWEKNLKFKDMICVKIVEYMDCVEKFKVYFVDVEFKKKKFGFVGVNGFFIVGMVKGKEVGEDGVFELDEDSKKLRLVLVGVIL